MSVLGSGVSETPFCSTGGPSGNGSIGLVVIGTSGASGTVGVSVIGVPGSSTGGGAGGPVSSVFGVAGEVGPVVGGAGTGTVGVSTPGLPVPPLAPVLGIGDWSLLGGAVGPPGIVLVPSDVDTVTDEPGGSSLAVVVVVPSVPNVVMMIVRFEWIDAAARGAARCSSTGTDNKAGTDHQRVMADLPFDISRTAATAAGGLRVPSEPSFRFSGPNHTLLSGGVNAE